MQSWRGKNTKKVEEMEEEEKKMEEKKMGKSEILRKFIRVKRDGASTSYAACKTCAGSEETLM